MASVSEAISSLFTSASLLCSAQQLSQQLAALPADSVQTSKRLIKTGSPEATRAVINDELVEFNRLLQTPEAQAIVQAFLAKSTAI